MKLSVVTPTFNEAGNILPFLRELKKHLAPCDYEIVVVDDDSPDLTWKVAAEATHADENGRVRVLRRTAERGLGNSVIDGFKNSVGDALACIDADLQHDPAIIPRMLAALEHGCDVVVASRYVEGGGTGKWSLVRLAGSRFATSLAKVMLGIHVHDPMSGYFMVRREDFRRVCDKLDGDGFKIMLELLVHLKPQRVVEIPYTFRSRVAGDSKLSRNVVFKYLRQLYRLSESAGRLPFRFLKFSAVGALGILINLSVMALLINFTSVRDWRASAVSTLVAMSSNFLINNAWTFRDRMVRGTNLFAAYVSYLLVSLVGLVVTAGAYAGITFGLALRSGIPHAGSLPDFTLMFAQLISILFGTYTNYTLNKRLTWRLEQGEERQVRPVPDFEEHNRAA